MKASDVFDLPVSVNHPFTSEVKVVTNTLAGDVCIEFLNNRQAYVAANCINHADALADALDNVIETLELYGAHDDPYYRIAIDELKKYRGCSDE